MTNGPLSEFVGIRVTPDEKERIAELSDTYRVGEAVIARRMLRHGFTNADVEELFADELRQDREREGIEA